MKTGEMARAQRKTEEVPVASGPWPLVVGKQKGRKGYLCGEEKRTNGRPRSHFGIHEVREQTYKQQQRRLKKISLKSVGISGKGRNRWSAQIGHLTRIKGGEGITTTKHQKGPAQNKKIALSNQK